MGIYKSNAEVIPWPALLRICSAAPTRTSPSSMALAIYNTEFNNLAKQDLPRIKQWVLREGRLFHKKLRTYLDRYDRDMTPNNREGEKMSNVAPETEKLGAKIFIGTFSLTTAPQADASKRPKKR